MVHFCVFPETGLFELRRFLRLCGVLKYTHVVLEFWGMLRFECLPELGWPQAYAKDEIRPLVQEARDLGLEIIPMFNHWGHASASRVMHGKHVVLDQDPGLQPYFSDDGWTWQIGKPEVRALLRAVRGELSELCGPGRYFHLGCDEPYGFDLTERSAPEVTGYLNGIAQELKKDGRRAIVWGDMLVADHASFRTGNRYTASCPDLRTEKILLDGLDREIIIADWQYGVREAPVETGLVFRDAGFDVLLCPWDHGTGCDSVSACAATVKEHRLYGLLHTTWHTLTAGMPDVTQAAENCWDRETRPFSLTYYGPRTAALLRRACSVRGDYAKAGWSPVQIMTEAR